jgi:hypothetical protein
MRLLGCLPFALASSEAAAAPGGSLSLGIAAEQVLLGAFFVDSERVDQRLWPAVTLRASLRWEFPR